jgi:hypothetical protein
MLQVAQQIYQINVSLLEQRDSNYGVDMASELVKQVPLQHTHLKSCLVSTDSYVDDYLFDLSQRLRHALAFVLAGMK